MTERMIIYADPFQDSDDMAAIYASTKTPVIKCELVVTTDDDAATRAAGTKEFLKLAGHPEIPVMYGKGAVRTSSFGFSMKETDYDFIAGLPLHQTDRYFDIRPNGEIYAAEKISADPGVYTILSLAPLTDLADTCKMADPKKLRRMFIMGGHVGEYDERPNAIHQHKRRSDYNFRSDVVATRKVLASSAEIYVVGKNIGSYHWFTMDDFKGLSSGTEAQRILLKMIEQRNAYMRRILPSDVKPVILMYDLVALGAVVFHELFDFRQMEMELDDDGLTHTRFTNTGNLCGAVDADLPRLKKNLLELLLG